MALALGFSSLECQVVKETALQDTVLTIGLAQETELHGTVVEETDLQKVALTTT